METRRAMPTIAARPAPGIVGGFALGVSVDACDGGATIGSVAEKAPSPYEQRSCGPLGEPTANCAQLSRIAIAVQPRASLPRVGPLCDRPEAGWTVACRALGALPPFLLKARPLALRRGAGMEVRGSGVERVVGGP